jgi:hypothetical protein
MRKSEELSKGEVQKPMKEQIAMRAMQINRITQNSKIPIQLK